MEYARNAVRMSALMKQRVLYVFTHDSIGLGEDGPTHQPIEQLASLRGTPNLDTWRPADAVESAVAWKYAIERADGPSALVFSRQNLPHQSRDAQQLADIARGGYVLKDCAGEPELILIATGSEVGLAMQAAAKLEEQGAPGARGFHAVHQRVRPAGRRPTSRPCCRCRSARASPSRPRMPTTGTVAWAWKVGVIGMTTFGESAPAPAAVRGVRLHRREHPGNRRRAAGRLTLSRSGVAGGAAGPSPHPSMNGGGGRTRTCRDPCPTRPYRVALNGYGRIGRCVLRALHERGAGGELEIVALNDLADQASIEYLTRFDSTHGRFPGEVQVDGDCLHINGDA